MSIEKRNNKMLNVIIIVILAVISVTAFGGFIMQRQIMNSQDGGMGISRGANPMMQPESVQSSPTGTLVMFTGIVLLLIGFGVLVVVLWVKLNRPQGHSA